MNPISFNPDDQSEATPFAATYEARVAQIAQEHISPLEQKSDSSPFDWSRFVLDQGGAVSWYREFSGGEVEKSLLGLKKFIENRSSKEAFFGPTPAQEVSAAIARAEALGQALYRPKMGALTNEDLKERVEAFRGELKGQLDVHGYAYLFSGTRGKTSGSAGHAVVLKFEKKEEEIFVSILNLGQGASAHPVLRKTATRLERSYRSLPIALSEEILNSEKGYCALSQLIRLYLEAPIENLNYDASEIYDCFQVMGGTPREEAYDPDLFALPEQQEPNCSEIAVQLFFRDILYHFMRDADLDSVQLRSEVDAIFLDLRFFHLIAAYHAPADDLEKHVFEYALRTFACHLLQMRPHLPEERYEVMGRAVIAMRDKKAALQNAPFKQRAQVDADLTPCKSEGETDTFEVGKKWKTVPPYDATLSVCEQIGRWMEEMEGLEREEVFFYFEACVATLPIPKAAEEDDWDFIPLAEVEDVIADLKRFLIAGFQHISNLHAEEDKREFALEEVFLAVHTLYAVVDKLVRRDPTLYLTDYASPFLLEREGNKPFSTLLMGEWQQRYFEIEAYFEEQKRGKRGEIFPLDSLLSPEGSLQKLMGRAVRTRAVSHAEFVRQFREHHEMIDLWEEGLPTPLRTLYYMAVVAQLSIPANPIGQVCSFPEELVWEREGELNGFTALRLVVEVDSDRSGIANRAPLDARRNWGVEKRPIDFYATKPNINQALVAHIPEKLAGKEIAISEEKWRALLVYSIDPNLSLYQFLENFPGGFTNPLVRKELYLALFAPGRLPRAIAEDQKVVSKVRALLQQRSVQAKKSPDSGTFLATCMLGVEALLSPHERELDPVKEILNSSHMWKHNELQLFYYALKESFSTEDCEAVLKILLYGANSDSLLTDREIKKLRRHCAERLVAAARVDEQVIDTLGAVIEGQFGLVDWESRLGVVWRLKEEGRIEGGDFSFDLYSGQFEKKGAGEAVWIRVDHNAPLRTLPFFSGLEKVFFGQKGEYFAADGRLKVVSDGKQHQAYYAFSVGGKEVWGELVSLDRNLLRGSIFYHLAQRAAFFRLPNNALAIVKGDKEQHIILYSESGKLTDFMLLSPKGEPTCVRLIDLTTLREEDRLMRYVHRFPFVEDLFCLHGEGKEPSLHFLSLGLEFTGGVCSRFPGYRLDMDAVWDRYPDALVLEPESGVGGKKVVIPARQLTQIASHFDAQIRPEFALIDWGRGAYYGERVKFFVFDEDPLTGRLSTNEPRAALYLALLYKMRREYDKALFYLYAFSLPTDLINQAEPLLNTFYALAERSNDSYVFNMHLLYRLVDSCLTMVEERIGDHEQLSRKWLVWSTSVYCDYLATLEGDHELSPVPKAWRLTYEQEGAILRFFYRIYDMDRFKGDKNKAPIHPLLLDRFRLICSKNQKIRTEIFTFKSFMLPKSIRSRALSYEELTKQWRKGVSSRARWSAAKVDLDAHGAVRFPTGSVLREFAFFYRLMRKQSPQAQSALVALFNSREDYRVDEAFYTTLLLYVFRFPEEFKEDERESLTVAKGVWDVICARGDLKEKMEEWIQEGASYQVGETDKTIALPPPLKREPLSLWELSGRTSLSPIYADLESAKRGYRELLRETQLLRKELIRELNTVLGNRVTDSLEAAAGQHLVILPEWVMQKVILRGDLSFLQKERPHFDKEKSKMVVEEVKEYYYRLALLRVIQESLPLFEKGAIEAAKKSLDFPSFDWSTYPEIAYYKVRGGKFPRPEQLEIYLDVCAEMEKGKSCGFQGAAGSGKTAYLRPLLMLRARMLGWMPVIITPPAIYEVDRQNLVDLWGSLGEGLGLLELQIKDACTADQYKYILRELERYAQEGRALLLKPQAWYALMLRAKNAALNENDARKVYFIEEILAFFKERCWVMMDEAHDTCDPTLYALLGIGEFQPLNAKYIDKLVGWMFPLVGVGEAVAIPSLGGKSVCAVARLVTHPVFQESMPTSKELDALKEALVSHFFPKAAKQAALERFLLDKEASLPAEVESLEEREEYALFRHFLLNLLPEAIRLRTNFDHTQSRYTDQEIQTPARNGVASTTQFQDPFFTVVLTIKALFQLGLTSSQLHALFNHMAEKDRIARRKGISMSAEQQLLETFTQTVPLEGNVLLYQLDSSTFFAIGGVKEKAQRHAPFIALFLKEIAFKKSVGSSPDLLTALPSQFVRGFGGAVLFSATPRIKEIYPASVENFRFQEEFEHAVLARCCAKENAHFYDFEGLAQMFKENRQAHVLLDPGGYLAERNEKVAQLWLKNNPDLIGVLFYDDGYLIFCGREKSYPLFGSEEIREQLEAHGVKWEKNKVGVYYDAGHTEAAHIALDQGARALFLFPEELGRARLIQAVMRMRGFLDAEMDQTLTWVLSPQFRNKLPQLSAQALCTWAAENDQKKEERQVVFNALHEMEYVVASQFLQEKRAERKQGSPKDIGNRLIKLYRERQEGLTDHPEGDIIRAYGMPEEETTMHAFLTSHATALHFAYYGTDVLDANTQRALDEVIARAERRVPSVSTAASKVGKEIEIECDIETTVDRYAQQEMFQLRPRTQEELSADMIYGSVGICKEDFATKIRSGEEGRDFYEINTLPTSLFLSACHAHTAHLSTDAEQTFWKPIQFFLIVKDAEGFFACVISNKMFAGSIEDLASFDREVMPHQALLISALSGVVVQRGRKGLRMSLEDEERVLFSPWLQSLRIYAAFLQGKIPHPEMHGIGRQEMIEALAHLPDVDLEWDRIRKKLIDLSKEDELAMHALIDEVSKFKRDHTLGEASSVPPSPPT